MNMDLGFGYKGAAFVRAFRNITVLIKSRLEFQYKQNTNITSSVTSTSGVKSTAQGAK